MLEPEIYLTIVENTPLVSIDLVVVTPDQRILVGKRTNEPARDTWFVPGGIIDKDERLDHAFARIAETELGPGIWNRSDAAFIGVFEHLYDANFNGTAGVTTHYVVLAYRIDADLLASDEFPPEQHSAYAWVDREGRAGDGTHLEVHENTAAYFGHL